MPLNRDVEDIVLCYSKPILLCGYIGPFLIAYAVVLTLFTRQIINIGLQDSNYEIYLIAFFSLGFLQILSSLFCMWSVYMRYLLSFTKAKSVDTASWVKVTPTPNNGSEELVPLKREKNPITEETEIWFIFQKVKYRYDKEEKKSFREVQHPVNESFNWFLDAKGYQEEDEIKLAELTYGNNIMKLDIPGFMNLFQERATAPFFVFQVFCVGLWCLDEYWYYSLFTLFMLIAFEATLVQQQLRNMSEIRKMGNKPFMIQTYRKRKWRPLMSDELVPGDIVSVGRSQDDRIIPCDLLLLRGSAIVDESLLTGESVPVMKEPIESVVDDAIFDSDAHEKLHVLSGGTKVVQHSPPPKSGPGLKATDNGCVAYVLRTGFNTSQGRLLKTIMYGVKRITANNLETFAFILFLLIFAIIASSYVWIEGTKDPTRNRYKLFLECTLILTSVVPPELPIELSLAVNTSLLALTKLNVFCTEPFRIPFAGKIDMCCFDKTGTLTSDNLVVEGISGVGEGEDLVPASAAPLPTVHILATCHSLVQLDDSLVGDPLEKATLAAIEWNLTKGDAVVPRRGRTHGLKIFHRFHFSSLLKRMSVICGHTTPGTVETLYKATVKGAPETLKQMFSSVPQNYDDNHLRLARRGARVLALGHKDLGALSHQEVRDLRRADVESKLTFAGFVVISCPLKNDSKAVIKEIVGASHQVIMITGDNPLTACHVAKELHITRRQKTLILTSPANGAQGWTWNSVDQSVSLPFDLETKKIAKLSHDLCITGEGLAYLATEEQKFFFSIIPHTKIFARVAPKQKEYVITTLKKLGYFTLMCGDGTNDVGALKHAHVGVALLSNMPEKLPEKVKSSESDGRAADSKSKSRSHKLQKKGISVAGDAPAANNAQQRLNSLVKQLEEEERASVVRLGDASIASPFTSKFSSAQCVCHIIKQGRCTLVTTLQMFKILALNALILAYSQSVLYLEGVKFSDSQATMQGLLMAGCFLFISRSKPLKTLSKERPLPNIFNVYTVLTVFCQFLVHLYSLVHLKQEADFRSPPRNGTFADLEADFKPNLLNSVVYIISMGLQLTTFAVNYKGLPFMESLSSNKPLLYSLFGAGLAIVLLASGVIPDICDQFEIVLFEAEFRNVVLFTLAIDMVACFLIDRTLQYLFGWGNSLSTR